VIPKCNIVAEIGAVHLGNMDRAINLCRLAKLCNVDYIKIQKRCPEESTPLAIQDKPHPNQMFAYGKTYLEHRKNLELTIQQHEKIKNFCENEIGVRYSTSVWDVTSAKEVVSLNPDYIKVGSPTNQNFTLLQYLCEYYVGGIHISLGMITKEERQEIIDFMKNKVDPSRVVYYHCTNEYPTPFNHMYLNEILEIRKIIPKESSIGFSNHGYGISIDPVAYAMGATWIERHFVDDRTLKHTDASFSLEPHGLSDLCRNIKAVQECMQYKEKMSDFEIEQRKKLKGM